MMNASPVTAIRTAAVTAVATRRLAREDAKVLAIVGAGVQAHAHLQALGPASRRCGSRAARATTPSRWRRSVGARPSEHRGGARGADVVCTSTNSSEPILRREWLKEGAHVNAVGACRPGAGRRRCATGRSSSTGASRREEAAILLRWSRARSRPGSMRSWASSSPAPRPGAARRTSSPSSVRSGSPWRTCSPPSTSSVAPGDGPRADDRLLIPLEEIRAARERIAGAAVRTPLVRLPEAPRSG